MPKYRQLHLKILDSFDFNDMPDDFTRVVWLLLPLIVDSEGRGISNIAWIRSKMFPMREEVALEQIGNAFHWLISRNMVIIYEVEGNQYFHIPKFKTYQSGTAKEGKSYIPAPPEVLGNNSVGTPEKLQSNSEATPPQYNTMQCNTKSIQYNAVPVLTPELVQNNSEPKEMKLFSIRDAEKAYKQVTEFASTPANMISHLEHILDLLKHYGWDETINRLTIAKNNWVSQKNKTTGAHYKLTNPAWIDYAITGESLGAPPELSREDQIKHDLEIMTKRNQ
jgi:hypothetical protein